MFQFMTSAKIVFGEGALNSSLSMLNQHGYSLLLVTGQNLGRALPVLNYLRTQRMRYQHIWVCGEPNITMVGEAAVAGRKFKPDMVVSLGGGSVMDMGKALSAIIPNQGDVYDYVETVGRSVPLKTKPLPFIAIPTTASTGSEVTNKAVLRSGQDKVKVSLRSGDILPEVAIVDPTLTYETSSAISARGAMEVFTHLMEAYVCGRPNPLTDMVCEEGLRRLSHSIIPACMRDDHQARSDLSFASMLGGMAISNAKLGAAHGLASSLGGKLGAPHSIITARMAPFVMRENIRTAEQAGRGDILDRYCEIAKIITQDAGADYHDSWRWAQSLLTQLRVPELNSFGICDTTFEKVAQDAMQSVSIRGNPLPLTEKRLIYILKQTCSCDDFSGFEKTEVLAGRVGVEEFDSQSTERV